MYFGDLVSVSKALWFSLFCLNVLYPLNKIDMTTSTKRSNVFHNAYLRYIAHRHTYISIVFNFPQKIKLTSIYLGHILETKYQSYRAIVLLHTYCM